MTSRGRLPSPETVRADVQRMVDFGPRLPGYEGHQHFCDWLAREFVAAGLDLLPCDEYVYDCWQPGAFGLEIVDGDAAGKLDVPTTYVRSAGTPADGVTGPLVYAGTMPTPGLSTALSGVAPDTTGDPEIRAWADALPCGSLEGSIAVVDLALPTPLNAGVFIAEGQGAGASTGAIRRGCQRSSPPVGPMSHLARLCRSRPRTARYRPPP
jgi:hypothetical protein